MPLARRSSRTAPNLLPPTFPRRVRFFRRSYDNDRLSQNCAAFTVRLPGSRCETGILKTVEFLTNLDESESIVPDCVHLSTTVLAGHARTESRTCVSRPGTCNRATARTHQGEELATGSSRSELSLADAPSHVYTPVCCVTGHNLRDFTSTE